MVGNIGQSHAGRALDDRSIDDDDRRQYAG